VARVARWLSSKGCALALGQGVDSATTFEINIMLELVSGMTQGQVAFYLATSPG
jgi:hypothetical protein